MLRQWAVFPGGVHAQKQAVMHQVKKQRAPLVHSGGNNGYGTRQCLQDARSGARTELVSAPAITQPEDEAENQETYHHQESMFAQVEQAPADPILSLTERYRADESPQRVNLGVGAYRTDAGYPSVLRCVQLAEEQLLEQQANEALFKEYAPIEGLTSFNSLAAQLALGSSADSVQDERIASVQALSGTGALRVACDFLAQKVKPPAILLPFPTWGNHNKIAPASGLTVRTYPHLDPSTGMLDEHGILEALHCSPERSVVLLHACAHNPTGIDPTKDQWQRILDAIVQKGHVPFFDVAYQGFASGDLEEDAYAIRLFEQSGIEMLFAQSFAKNMGLYGERVGALHVITRTTEQATAVRSQLKQIIRAMYSSPPIHGALIAKRVLEDPALCNMWQEEMEEMSQRLSHMRRALYEELKRLEAPGSWSHLLGQIGMFSYTGLTEAQCANMTQKWHVYLTGDGRISLAGLSNENCAYVAQAIKDSVLACE